MIKDEVVEEVRKARQELGARWNFNLKEQLLDARKRQEQSGHPVVSFPSREPRPGVIAYPENNQPAAPPPAPVPPAPGPNHM